MKSLCHTPCWDCGCDFFNYTPFEFDSGIYKLRCKECGKIIEGERAEEIFTECGIFEETSLSEEEYTKLVDWAIGLLSNSIRKDKQLLKMFRDGHEKFFRKLPLCKNTITTVKGIIGYHKYCSTHNSMKKFMMDSLHDITECNKNYREEHFTSRTQSYVDYKKGLKT